MSEGIAHLTLDPIWLAALARLAGTPALVALASGRSPVLHDPGPGASELDPAVIPDLEANIGVELPELLDAMWLRLAVAPLEGLQAEVEASMTRSLTAREADAFAAVAWQERWRSLGALAALRESPPEPGAMLAALRIDLALSRAAARQLASWSPGVRRVA